MASSGWAPDTHPELPIAPGVLDSDKPFPSEFSVDLAASRPECSQGLPQSSVASFRVGREP